MTQLQEKLLSTLRTVPDFPKPGIQFKDISPIFQDPQLCKEIILTLTHHYAPLNIEAVVGVESRGFLFGSGLAIALNIPFILVRKAGKLPGPTYHLNYELEYGTAAIEVQQEAITKGQRVLIHDDLLATGGTAAATAQLVQKAGAEVTGFCFLMELSYLEGRKNLATFSAEIYSMLVL